MADGPMTDSEWLDYFQAHCRTERAGFVKSNLDKLCELAGVGHFPALSEGTIYTVRADTIMPLVEKARARLEPSAALT